MAGTARPATRGLPSCLLASALVAFPAPRSVWWADCYRRVCSSGLSVIVQRFASLSLCLAA